ncbi:hypothetical protein DPMN_145475 [Dreissena polymorpha]|uniref:Uncharacterized protein n=1 Tax=Dreissena polymorpha TaxID=45954 RepID=A0A9D4F632_DREPO|nr:hypothetical protein DPMN_145475 [Dreissena polymorpha]
MRHGGRLESRNIGKESRRRGGTIKGMRQRGQLEGKDRIMDEVVKAKNAGREWANGKPRNGPIFIHSILQRTNVLLFSFSVVTLGQ